MIIEVKIPSPGESITEVQLASWLVKDGEIVERDAEIAEVDSDKATLTINAPEQGMINFKVQEGDTVNVGAVVATIDTSAVPQGNEKSKSEPVKVEAVANATAQSKPVAADPVNAKVSEPESAGRATTERSHITPLARKMMEEKNISSEEVLQQVNKKRVGKADVENMSAVKNSAATTEIKEESKKPVVESKPGSRDTERKKMTTLRLKLSERLVSVKNETAMLTTFNEVNMSGIMDLRKKYNDKFKEKHGISLGFMSLFTKAVTIALKQFPQVNSIIDGDEMIYHSYVDVGIAVSSPKGLVVPVLRNTETMSLADIELKIKELAEKARNNKISLDEMTGGTFTISNGGVFGSLLSTPILNPPQSAILGMHNIVDRPIAVNGQVVIAPMMYVALSYDHRVIDGKESVSFLVKVKELLERPEIMFFEGKDPFKGLLGLD